MVTISALNTVDLELYCAEILSFCVDSDEKVVLEVLLFSKEDRIARSVELCFYHLSSTQIKTLGSPWLKKIISFEIDGLPIGLPINDSVFSEHSPHRFKIVLENNSKFEIEAYRFYSSVKKEIKRR